MTRPLTGDEAAQVRKLAKAHYGVDMSAPQVRAFMRHETDVEPNCIIGEARVTGNTISFYHSDTGLEIAVVTGKKRQDAMRKVLHNAGTCEYGELRRIAAAALPPRGMKEDGAPSLTDLDLKLLRAFSEENGAPAGFVSKDLGMSTAAVTRAAKSLESRGLLEDTGYAMKYVGRTGNWQFIDKPKDEGGMVTKPGASTVWRATLTGLAAIDKEPSPYVDWTP